MKTVEMSGKTVEEAIDKALEALNEEKDNVIIEVIDEIGRASCRERV